MNSKLEKKRRSTGTIWTKLENAERNERENPKPINTKITILERTAAAAAEGWIYFTGQNFVPDYVFA